MPVVIGQRQSGGGKLFDPNYSPSNHRQTLRTFAASMSALCEVPIEVRETNGTPCAYKNPNGNGGYVLRITDTSGFSGSIDPAYGVAVHELAHCILGTPSEGDAWIRSKPKPQWSLAREAVQALVDPLDEALISQVLGTEAERLLLAANACTLINLAATNPGYLSLLHSKVSNGTATPSELTMWFISQYMARKTFHYGMEAAGDKQIVNDASIVLLETIAEADTCTLTDEYNSIVSDAIRDDSYSQSSAGVRSISRRGSAWKSTIGAFEKLYTLYLTYQQQQQQQQQQNGSNNNSNNQKGQSDGNKSESNGDGSGDNGSGESKGSSEGSGKGSRSEGRSQKSKGGRTQSSKGAQNPDVPGATGGDDPLDEEEGSGSSESDGSPSGVDGPASEKPERTGGSNRPQDGDDSASGYRKDQDGDEDSGEGSGGRESLDGKDGPDVQQDGPQRGHSTGQSERDESAGQSESDTGGGNEAKGNQSPQPENRGDARQRQPSVLDRNDFDAAKADMISAQYGDQPGEPGEPGGGFNPTDGLVFITSADAMHSQKLRMRRLIAPVLEAPDYRRRSPAMSGVKIGAVHRCATDGRCLLSTGLHESERTALCLVVDGSGSMTSLIQETASAAASVIDAFDRCGASTRCLVFGQKNYVQDLGSGRSAVSKLSGIHAWGGTDTDVAIRMGRLWLSKQDEPNKVMVLLTDGAPNSVENTAHESLQLKRHGITLLVGTIGALSVSDYLSSTPNAHLFPINDNIGAGLARAVRLAIRSRSTGHEGSTR